MKILVVHPHGFERPPTAKWHAISSAWHAFSGTLWHLHRFWKPYSKKENKRDNAVTARSPIYFCTNHIFLLHKNNKRSQGHWNDATCSVSKMRSKIYISCSLACPEPMKLGPPRFVTKPLRKGIYGARFGDGTSQTRICPLWQCMQLFQASDDRARTFHNTLLRC